jgi:HNH endonuclease
LPPLELGQPVLEVIMREPKPLPPVEVLRELFSYDPESGVITNRVSRSVSRAGQETGTQRPDGYRSVTLNRERYLVHRIAWKLHTGAEPPVHIDHIDRDPTNNRFSNLRASDPLNNQGNRKPKTNRYAAGVKRNGTRWVSQGGGRYLGSFDTKEEAHQAYVQWHLHKFGEHSIYA